MKKIITTLFGCASLFFAATAIAQDQGGERPAPPRWFSEKGYWVVESNLKTPDQSIVSFYSTTGKLIYKEKVEGVVLNCKKRKTLMKLKRVLEKVVDGHEVNGKLKEGKEVAAYFTGKRKNS